MSYKPPPKSPYGDTDFTYDDNWSAQSQPGQSFGTPAPVDGAWSASPNSPPRNSRPVPSQPINAPQNEKIQDLVGAVTSTSQEDLLFMRKWQRDGFFYRVIPLTLITNGAIYFMHKRKGLSNITARYIGGMIFGYIVGKASYMGELRRRVSQTPIDTPFMQALRRTLSLPPREGEQLWDSDDQSAYPPVRLGGAEINEFSNPNSAGDYQPVFGSEEQTLGSPKQAVSYEELRARNRGLIR